MWNDRHWEKLPGQTSRFTNPEGGKVCCYLCRCKVSRWSLPTHVIYGKTFFISGISFGNKVDLLVDFDFLIYTAVNHRIIIQ